MVEMNFQLGRSLGRNVKNEINLGGADQSNFPKWLDSENVSSPKPDLPKGSTMFKIAANVWDKIASAEKQVSSADKPSERTSPKLEIFEIIKRHIPGAPCEKFDKETFCGWFRDLAESEREALKMLEQSERPFPAQSVVRVLRMSYNAANIYGEDWREKKSIVSVSMVAVSGGVFRKERLAWQDRQGQFPEDTQRPGETETEMNSRIRDELKGDEPWTDALRSIRVFFGTPKWFADREKAGNVPIERQEASLKFWTGYLEKLKDGRLPNLKIAELYPIDNPGFYAHVKTYAGLTSGHIVGCNLFAAADFPHAFEIWWPPKVDKPASFLVIEEAIKRLGSARKRDKMVF
jgi:hypothetical protein